jgi:hypothetical protein
VEKAKAPLTRRSIVGFHELPVGSLRVSRLMKIEPLARGDAANKLVQIVNN